jgi:sterol-4alpha-carboxylate 3-dehydrogenase (decarboxylating)
VLVMALKRQLPLTTSLLQSASYLKSLLSLLTFAPPTMAPLLGTVLITGGGGFLGSHVVDAFQVDPECNQVVATYRQERPGQHTNPLTKYHVCDVTDYRHVAALLEKVNPDIIIHAIMPGAFAPPEAQYHVNYESTKHLLLLAREHPTVKALIYASSAEAVGLASGFNTKPETEEDSVLCTLETGSNPYARTKGAADALVLAFNSRERPSKADFKGQLLTTAIRFPGIYGPRDVMISERFYCMANTLGTRIQLGPNKARHS